MKAVWNVSAIVIMLLLGMSCASGSVKTPGGRVPDQNGDYYTDSLDSFSNHYSNQTIGFSLDFKDSWKLYPHYNTLPGDAVGFADQFRENGAEMLLIGMSPRGLYGMRVSVEEVDMPVKEYFAVIRSINAREFSRDSFRETTVNGKQAVEWQMQLSKNNVDLRYLEYQLKNGPFNLRITFWTAEALFQAYEPLFRNVIGSYAEAGSGTLTYRFSEHP